MIQVNVGAPDRALRMIAGIALVALAGFGTIGAWGYLGIVPLASGTLAFCPLYRLLGLSTAAR